jgi:hypothetical protein
MEITLKLTLEQVNGIIYALGELPVKTGAAQLVSLIHEQVQPQVPEQPPEQPQESAEEVSEE